MRGVRACALVVLALLTACQSQPQPASPPTAEDPGTLAARALSAGRYGEAVELYRQALAASPDTVGLHYGLGVACSYVDRRDEAVREFRWVMQYGPRNSAEVEGARQWLTRAGALPVVLSARSGPNPADRGRQAGNASLEGRAVYAEAGQTPQPMSQLQFFLVGQPDSPTKEERYNLRTDEDGTFKFPDVIPGPYKLTDRVAGPPIWRLRVELKPSETKVLELGPSNSLASQDDFPEPQARAKE
jgi:tetratricopeptide (TPR) repeat protein